MLAFSLDVTWPGGRTVRASLRALPLLRSGEADRPDGRDAARSLGPGDVASLSALHAFLAKATRTAAAGATVEIVGFEPDVDALLDLIGVEGPVPEAIRVALPPQ